MNAPDLSQQPPRSPSVRIRDYAILARVIDKCRAQIAGTLGEYHYNCPLDNILFNFKGVIAEEFKREVRRATGDEEIGLWLDERGLAKTPEEIKAWSDSIEAYSMISHPDPEKRRHFITDCKRLGLDPHQTTLFEWLEADDAASFPAYSHT